MKKGNGRRDARPKARRWYEREMQRAKRAAAEELSMERELELYWQGSITAQLSDKVAFRTVEEKYGR